MKEIGSEFYKVAPDSGTGIKLPRSGTFVFSGRTAIEAVLYHLQDARSVLLPSYCCDSMIVPFKSVGLDVKFYNVDWDDGLKVEIKESADILVWCNYFGFKNVIPHFEGVIIEDITHSLLSDLPAHSQSDYLVCSLRKWEPINCGGYCSVEAKGMEPPYEFIKEKAMAMKLKSEYLEDSRVEKKNRFLQMFSDSNKWLAKNYSGYLIDAYSLEYLQQADIEKQKIIRRKNAKLLYDGLGEKIQFMFPIEDMDCPLFVPVLLSNRDKVREYLIKNDIYCPIHWPKPVGCESNIYDKELSLICDQRYGDADMERIVSTIKEIL
jgi:hypothetical protein